MQIFGNLVIRQGETHFHQAMSHKHATELREKWINGVSGAYDWKSEPLTAVITIPDRIEAEIKKVKSGKIGD